MWGGGESALRVGKLVLGLLGPLFLGCTHPVQQASITGRPPSSLDTVTQDATVPGGRRGTFSVRDADLAGLRETLSALFEDTGKASLELRFNPVLGAADQSSPCSSKLSPAAAATGACLELLSSAPSPRSPAGVELFPAAPYPVSALAGAATEAGAPPSPVSLNFTFLSALNSPTQLPLHDVATPAGLGAFLPRGAGRHAGGADEGSRGDCGD